jgi:hypothetical protein
MEHFYETVEGWFDFEDVYSAAVSKAQDGAHFVEVGSWFGKSTVYMGVEVLNSGKSIRFDAIDHWGGSPDEMAETGMETPMFKYLQNNSVEDAYNTFLNNIEPCKDYITVVRGDSMKLVNDYKNNSLDFVFIDSDHSYENVKKEILNWWPKLKVGATIGGHDYNHPPVSRAVFDTLGRLGVIHVFNRSWVVLKED